MRNVIEPKFVANQRLATNDRVVRNGAQFEL